MPGENVRAYRLARGWTQVELAEKTMLSAVTISMIERDRVPGHANTIRRIAKALRVKVRQLERPLPEGVVTNNRSQRIAAG